MTKIANDFAHLIEAIASDNEESAEVWKARALAMLPILQAAIELTQSQYDIRQSGTAMLVPINEYSILRAVVDNYIREAQIKALPDVITVQISAGSQKGKTATVTIQDKRFKRYLNEYLIQKVIEHCFRNGLLTYDRDEIYEGGAWTPENYYNRQDKSWCDPSEIVVGTITINDTIKE